MKTFYKELKLESIRQFEVIDITEHIIGIVGEAGIKNGVVTIQSAHTTASIRVNHYEPMLMQDVMSAMYRLVPQGMNYSHDVFELRKEPKPDERSNGHAHVKAFLVGTSETIILHESKLMLGAKQSILFAEFDGPRKRSVHVQLSGE